MTVDPGRLSVQHRRDDLAVPLRLLRIIGQREVGLFAFEDESSHDGDTIVCSHHRAPHEAGRVRPIAHRFLEYIERHRQFRGHYRSVVGHHATVGEEPTCRAKTDNLRHWTQRDQNVSGQNRYV